MVGRGTRRFCPPRATTRLRDPPWCCGRCAMFARCWCSAGMCSTRCIVGLFSQARAVTLVTPRPLHLIRCWFTVHHAPRTAHRPPSTRPVRLHRLVSHSARGGFGGGVLEAAYGLEYRDWPGRALFAFGRHASLGPRFRTRGMPRPAI